VRTAATGIILVRIEPRRDHHLKDGFNNKYPNDIWKCLDMYQVRLEFMQAGDDATEGFPHCTTRTTTSQWNICLH
jgi:hypothetical protein